MMAGRSHPLDLLREVLDHELVDVNGTSCGMVDDLEFESTPEGPVLVALRVGPGAWGPRLPALLQWACAHLFGREVHRVPWQEVADVGEVIRLRRSAGALGLGALDRKVDAWMRRLPGT
jgi:sporulation protein YlmC with PRC-barrel domain